MKAKFVNENIGDILKGKPELEDEYNEHMLNKRFGNSWAVVYDMDDGSKAIDTFKWKISAHDAFEPDDGDELVYLKTYQDFYDLCIKYNIPIRKLSPGKNSI